MGCAGEDAVEALRSASRQLLAAEEAHRMSPTLENVARLARARRAVEEALAAGEERDRTGAGGPHS
ncbi:MAG TPA: hypothetical protein VIL48_04335 [Acidimicrobiales bacterium]